MPDDFVVVAADSEVRDALWRGLEELVERPNGRPVFVPVLDQDVADDVPPAAHLTGDAIALASPDGPLTNALLNRAEPVYAVTRDQINDAATVVVGETIGAGTPDGEGRLELTNRVAATVAADRPGSARLEGHSTMDASGPNGHIVVETEIFLHDELTIASGTVTWNGQRVFSRQWTA